LKCDGRLISCVAGKQSQKTNQYRHIEGERNLATVLFSKINFARLAK